MDPLFTCDRPLKQGIVVDRPNRFVVCVRFDDGPKRVYLADPGKLDGIVEPERPILCTPVDDPGRATDYDAIAVEADGVYVSVRAVLANDLFAAALDRGLLPDFEGYTIQQREPPLPDHGRTDFLLSGPGGRDAYVEVKSCTSVVDGVAKFPDRPTERGRRHLESLRGLHESGQETHLVFVVQRPDADHVQPYRQVDPAFADRLATVVHAGVTVHATATTFVPPTYHLARPRLPVELT